MSPSVLIKRRVTPLATLLAVVTLLLALGTVFFNTRANAAEPTADLTVAQHHDDASAPVLRTAKQAAFQDQMRKLWEDHVTWTRLAIVSFADESGNFNATAARLLQNQTDIGDAIKPYYGEEAGNALTALLRDHITIAVELLQAAKAGDTGAFNDANARWYANSDDIADLISSVNPSEWPQSEMRAAMKMHLDQTLAEAAHELGGEYEASVADYDEIHLHILAMADQLSTGIMAQFPNMFR